MTSNVIFSFLKKKNLILKTYYNFNIIKILKELSFTPSIEDGFLR